MLQVMFSCFTHLLLSCCIPLFSLFTHHALVEPGSQHAHGRFCFAAEIESADTLQLFLQRGKNLLYLLYVLSDA